LKDKCAFLYRICTQRFKVGVNCELWINLKVKIVWQYKNIYHFLCEKFRN
jgi:hypothetical protein